MRKLTIAVLSMCFATIATAAYYEQQTNSLIGKIYRAEHAAVAAIEQRNAIIDATRSVAGVDGTVWARQFTVTAYTQYSSAYGRWNTGYTSVGVFAHPKKRIVAVDPRVIPYYSWVWIEGLGWYQALDKGGAIKGYKLDLLIENSEKARQFGRKDLYVIVVPPKSY